MADVLHDDEQGNVMVRVTLASGDELFRQGIRALLERHHAIEVVADGGSVDDIARDVRTCAPDVAVIEEDSIAGDVEDLLSAARTSSATTRCLLVSSRATSASVRRAFEQGACGIITRSARVDDLFAAIDRLHNGDHYLHPSLGARTMLCDVALEKLTPRERQIASQLALGHTNREIASLACVSPRTVETHRANIMAKLGVSSRAELVRWALDSRLIAATGE